jgi:hypothetical protein
MLGSGETAGAASSSGGISLTGGATVVPAPGWMVNHQTGNGVLLVHENPEGFFLVVAMRGTLTNPVSALKADAGANLPSPRKLRKIVTLKAVNFASFNKVATAGFSINGKKNQFSTRFGEAVELVDASDGYRVFTALIPFSLNGLKSLTPGITEMIGVIGDDSPS